MGVTLIRGIPGAGKTRWVAQNFGEALVRACWTMHGKFDNPKLSRVYSADDYFCDEVDRYQFDPARIAAAHQECLSAFAGAVTWTTKYRELIVDNTNISAVEMAPYVALAQANKRDVRIVTLIVDPGTAFDRCRHGVPAARVFDMDRRLRSEDVPPWWPHEVVFS